jgi:isopenicillin N synthase-like dioxygenase
MEEIPVIEV